MGVQNSSVMDGFTSVGTGVTDTFQSGLKTGNPIAQDQDGDIDFTGTMIKRAGAMVGNRINGIKELGSSFSDGAGEFDFSKGMQSAWKRSLSDLGSSGELVQKSAQESQKSYQKSSEEQQKRLQEDELNYLSAENERRRILQARQQEEDENLIQEVIGSV